MAYIIITKKDRGVEVIEWVASGDTTRKFPEEINIYRCANAAELLTQLNTIDPTWESKFVLNPTKL